MDVEIQLEFIVLLLLTTNKRSVSIYCDRLEFLLS